MKIADIKSKQLTSAQTEILADAMRLYCGRLAVHSGRVARQGKEQAKEMERAANAVKEYIEAAREIHLLF